jgi:hypothetical protein
MGGVTLDKGPDQQEVQDNLGSSVVYSGTANTTPAGVPAVAGNIISGFDIDNYGNQDMFISMDGGTTYRTLAKSDYYSWNLKGNQTQIYVKTLTDTCDYEMTINFEDM